jgi:hypothetical protein
MISQVWDRPTTNIELSQIANHYRIPLNGILMKDEVKPSLKAGNWIMNLDDSSGEGTHWCCFILTKSNVFYFDPFGFIMPDNPFRAWSKKTIYYNPIQIQDIHSQNCGMFCLGLFYYFQLIPNVSDNNLLTHFDNYCEMFEDKNFKANDKMIKRLFAINSKV